MACNTRFNPTCNGPLHLGHAYNCLMNREYAHSRGGKFHIRMDDDTRYWVQKVGTATSREISLKQLDDLAWLGIEADQVSWQSELEPIALRELAKSRIVMVEDHFPYNTESACQFFSKPDVMDTGLTTFITAAKVVFDHWERIGAALRGYELHAEHALYMYFWYVLGYAHPPKLIYIPRLMHDNGDELAEVSKTIGSLKICEFRRSNVSPTSVLEVLRAACLEDPGGKWEMPNLKFQPSIPRGVLGCL